MTSPRLPSAPSVPPRAGKTDEEPTTFTYRMVTSSLRSLLRILCRIDDSELTRVPEQGPLIIILNHINFLEVPVMYTHLQPRSLTGFVKAETQDNPFLGPLLFALWGGIPIQRGEAGGSRGYPQRPWTFAAGPAWHRLSRIP
jgi:1-acyl-sn-glycerol-3-phosphate acyltransferase